MKLHSLQLFRLALVSLVAIFIGACGSAVESDFSDSALAQSETLAGDADSGVPLYRGYMVWNQETGPNGEAYIQWSNSPSTLAQVHGPNLLIASPYLADTNILSAVTIGSLSGAGNTYFSSRDSGLQSRVGMHLKSAGSYQNVVLGIGKNFLGQWIAYGGKDAVAGQTTGFYYWPAGDLNSTSVDAVAHFMIYNPSSTANVAFPVEVRATAAGGRIVMINQVSSGHPIDFTLGGPKVNFYAGDLDYATPSYLTDSQRFVISGLGLDNVTQVDFLTETKNGGGTPSYSTETLQIRKQNATSIETEPPADLVGSIASNPSGKVVYVDISISDGRLIHMPLKVGMRYLWGVNTVAADVGHHVGYIVDLPAGLSNSGTAACPTASFGTNFIGGFAHFSLPSVQTVYATWDDLNCPGATGETFRVIAGADRNNSNSLNIGDSTVTGSVVVSKAGCGSLNYGPDNLLLTTSRSVYACATAIPLGTLNDTSGP